MTYNPCISLNVKCSLCYIQSPSERNVQSSL